MLVTSSLKILLFRTRGFRTVMALIGIIRISEAVECHAAILTLSAGRQVEERIERVEAVRVQRESVLFPQAQLRHRDVDAGSR